MTRVIAEYGTAFMHTQVTELGGGAFAWSRTPGPANPAGGTPLSPAAREAAHDTDDAGVSLVLPERRNGSLRYILPAPFSSARHLHSTDERALSAVVEGLRATGITLRRLHRRAPPPRAATVPPGLRRLAAWLDGAERPTAAIRLRSRARRRLGSARLERVRQWCECVGTPDSVLSFLHGEPSLGRLVLAETPASGGMLVENEFTRGPAAFDLGWLIGELVELDLAAAQGLGTARRLDYGKAARAFTNGYGELPEPLVLDRSAALRVLTHVHDYAAYVGWHEDLEGYVEILAELIDGDGGRTRDAFGL
ncbi:hypothetical protein GCM10009799_33750 [Nocardiopsis rhodophaea]|uniref:Aminoglycoside phosphotransferase domain-containing protein n=1 Tax=Nocardiopsis rhodophaea TaxID=280238 RepID=A0ABP5EP71_9ACTN